MTNRAGNQENGRRPWNILMSVVVASALLSTLSGCCSLARKHCNSLPVPCDPPDVAMLFVPHDQCVVIDGECRWNGLSECATVHPEQLHVQPGDLVVFTNHTKCEMTLEFAAGLFVEGRKHILGTGSVLVLTVTNSPPSDTAISITFMPPTCECDLPGPSIIVQDDP